MTYMENYGKAFLKFTASMPEWESKQFRKEGLNALGFHRKSKAKHIFDNSLDVKPFRRS